MHQNSPYSAIGFGHRIDFELRLFIHDSPIRLRPYPSCERSTVQWECGLCGHRDSVKIHPAWSTESRLIAGKRAAVEHMLRAHPSASTLTLLEGLQFPDTLESIAKGRKDDSG